MAKLPKAQQEFFEEFARAGVQNTLGPALRYKGLEITEDQVSAVIDTIDLKQLTDTIAMKFTDRVEFKTIKKVDTFMKSDEFRTVIEASQYVNSEINDLLISIIAPLIPKDSEA